MLGSALASVMLSKLHSSRTSVAVAALATEAVWRLTMTNLKKKYSNYPSTTAKYDNHSTFSCTSLDSGYMLQSV